MIFFVLLPVTGFVPAAGWKDGFSYDVGLGCAVGVSRPESLAAFKARCFLGDLWWLFVAGAWPSIPDCE